MWTENPRERLLTEGARQLTDIELLAVFLGTGTAKKNVMSLAREILLKFNGIQGLLRSKPEDLRLVSGLGTAKIATLLASRELTERFISESFRRGETVSDSASARQHLRTKMAGYQQEVFACLFLDNKHRIIVFEELFFGTIDGATVHPREVLKRAMYHNAAAVILAHNHPSGIADPSQADQRVTSRLKELLAVVDVRLLDHLVIGDKQVVSLAELGML